MSNNRELCPITTTDSSATLSVPTLLYRAYTYCYNILHQKFTAFQINVPQYNVAKHAFKPEMHKNFN